MYLMEVRDRAFHVRFIHLIFIVVLSITLVNVTDVATNVRERNTSSILHEIRTVSSRRYYCPTGFIFKMD
jgi:hypothetical protein